MATSATSGERPPHRRRVHRETVQVIAESLLGAGFPDDQVYWAAEVLVQAVEHLRVDERGITFHVSP